MPLVNGFINKQLCMRPPQYAPAPCKLTFDLESGVRVRCDVGYVCANFSLPRPLCSQLRPDVRDSQTDVRRASSLNAPYPRGGDIITLCSTPNHTSIRCLIKSSTTCIFFWQTGCKLSQDFVVKCTEVMAVRQP